MGDIENGQFNRSTNRVGKSDCGVDSIIILGGEKWEQ